MKKIKVIGILIRDRIKESGRTQAVLSRYDDIIQSRLGSHELSEQVCSRVGLILLTLGGDHTRWDSLEEELTAIGGLEVKEMLFEY